MARRCRTFGLKVLTKLISLAEIIAFFATIIFALILVLKIFGIGFTPPLASLWEILTNETTFYLLTSLAIFVLSKCFFAHMRRRRKKTVIKINAQHGLSFDTELLLDSSSLVFIAFDRQNRKMAFCSVVDGILSIHDFSWVLGWEITWSESRQVRLHTNSYSGHATGNVHENCTNFVILLKTADPHRPLIQFPMGSQRAATFWSARLSAIFNG